MMRRPVVTEVPLMEALRAPTVRPQILILDLDIIWKAQGEGRLR
jgi:hypothetical protein